MLQSLLLLTPPFFGVAWLVHSPFYLRIVGFGNFTDLIWPLNLRFRRAILRPLIHQNIQRLRLLLILLFTLVVFDIHIGGEFLLDEFCGVYV